MNNWLRYHSHIVDSPCCCACHVLRDCWHAREFGGSWPLRIVGRVFSKALSTLFFFFLSLTEDVGQSNFCSSVIFGVAIRKIWKWRNDKIFEHKAHPNGGAADALDFVCDIEKSQQFGSC